MIYLGAVFFPLLGAAIVGLLNNRFSDRFSQHLTCLMVLSASFFSLLIFSDVVINGNEKTIMLFSWINSGSMVVNWSLQFDQLSSVMLLVVNSVSCVIHFYSIGYMRDDKSIPRFFSLISLFTFFMLILVTSDNLVQLFFGWEGVGLTSYLLIGFWYEKPAANAAAIKAFLVNRIGDLGFVLGIFFIYNLSGSINFSDIFSSVESYADSKISFYGFEVYEITLACLLLFFGAMGKSAQLGLHTWLPDAMEGPTPVSALIHAATMVTAGIFMVARFSPVFEMSEVALMVVAFVGASTAFFAATVALIQNDIKRVIAYSTCSQLGYMFFAAGVSAYSAAIFHLMTHAFFKALLFLAAGSIIHAFSGEQDMRKMGGVYKKIPFTYLFMWVGSLALAGIPFFAGYFSKDIILESAWLTTSAVGKFSFALGIITVFLTALYAWRTLFLVFHGKCRSGAKVFNSVHEPSLYMIIPPVFLVIGSVVSGYVGYQYFVGSDHMSFWGNSLYTQTSISYFDLTKNISSYIKNLPILFSVLGVLIAFLLYSVFPRVPKLLAEYFLTLYNFLKNKWYFDEIYNRYLVQPILFVSRGLWKTIDQEIIDEMGPDGIAKKILSIGRRFIKIQSGYIYHYAFAMVLGLTIIVSYFLLTG